MWSCKPNTCFVKDLCDEEIIWILNLFVEHMDNPEINLPENADKILFAEDVVSYIMTDWYLCPYEGTQATPYRDSIFTAFNDTVRVAIDEIVKRIICQEYFLYDAIARIREPDENIYRELIGNLTDYFKTEDGFEPKLFLVYCANVSMIGAIMRKNGFEEAAGIAVSSIYEFIKDIDMLRTGWKTLNVLSSTVLTLRQDCNNMLTPKSLSPDIDGLFTDSEEEDSQMSSSDKRDSPQHSESDVEDPMEENEIKINMADALGVSINSCSVNVGSICVPRRENLLQPNATGEVGMKGETESTKNEMSLTYSINDLFQIKNVEFENRLISSLPTEEKSVDSLQEDKTNTLAVNANSEAVKNLTDTKDLKLEADSETQQNSHQLKENTAQLPIFRECKIFSDDNCIIAKQQGNSE